FRSQSALREIAPRERLRGDVESPQLAGRDLRRLLDDRRSLGLALRQQARRDDLLRPGERLDLRQDLLTDVRVLAQEGGGVLASLAEPLVLEAEVRARLLDDLPLQSRVEHRAFPGDPGAVDDVELGLLER